MVGSSNTGRVINRVRVHLATATRELDACTLGHAEVSAFTDSTATQFISVNA
jgi:hypothetical protein